MEPLARYFGGPKGSQFKIDNPSTAGQRVLKTRPMGNNQANDTGPAVGISIIIPCWKDLDAAVEIGQKWNSHALVRDVIVATVPGHVSAPASRWDGGVAGTQPPSMAGSRLKICQAERIGRGLQMNAGAAVAQGDVLLFHHVDSYLTERHLHSLVEAMRDPAIVGGAFYRRFDERHPGLLWAEKVERWHSRTFGALYGDQSIFVRRDYFVGMGGFAPLPLMEDVEFTLRLRRSGKIALLDPPMSSSPVRQIAHGAWRTTLRNLAFLLLFRLGVSAQFLHSWYYRPTRNASGNRSASDHNGYGTKTLRRLKEDHGA